MMVWPYSKVYNFCLTKNKLEYLDFLGGDGSWTFSGDAIGASLNYVGRQGGEGG